MFWRFLLVSGGSWDLMCGKFCISLFIKYVSISIGYQVFFDNTPLLNIEYSVIWKVFTLEQFIFCWLHRPFAAFAFGTGILSGQMDSLIIY